MHSGYTLLSVDCICSMATNYTHPYFKLCTVSTNGAQLFTNCAQCLQMVHIVDKQCTSVQHVQIVDSGYKLLCTNVNGARCSPMATQGRVTSPWCGGVTGGGGVPRATMQSGGDPGSATAAGSREAPSLAGHCGGATVAQGGLHQGVAVCEGFPGLPVVLPTPGLACSPSSPPAPPCGRHRGSWGCGRTRSKFGIMRYFTEAPSALRWPPWR